MIWISEFFFCVGTMSLVGSIAYIIFLIFRKMMAKLRRGFILHIIKTIIILYLVPVVYMVLRMSKIEFSDGTWYNVGHFGASTSPVFTKVFNVIVLVWFVGLVSCVLIRFAEYMRLRNDLKVSIPVAEEQWALLVNEECEKYHLRPVPVLQNERFRSPITTRLFRPMIILPLLKFSDKEMRMMAEHEVNHIRSHDMIWKWLALWVSWLHWFNPLNYLLISQLGIEQEIECDMFVCEHTTSYSAKEYFEFMMSLGEGDRTFTFSATLFESKKDIIRRAEAMRERRKNGKAGKTVLLICSLVLVIVSSVPAYAMAEKVAGAEERIVYTTEGMNENSTVNNTEYSFPGDDGVNTVVIDIDTYGSLVVINFTAAANTRYYIKSQNMVVGDQVGVNVQCGDSDALFWVGIKDVYMNTGRYVQGTGTLTHTFTITEEGTYRVFIENKSDSEVDFLGSATYPY